MLDAFNRPNCGFFDPSLPFGGPDNEPDLRPGGRARNRRSDPKNTFGSDFETYDYDDDGTLLRYDKECILYISKYQILKIFKFPCVFYFFKLIKNFSEQPNPWYQTNHDGIPKMGGTIH